MIIREIFEYSDAAKQYKEDILKIEFNARPEYKRVITDILPGMDPSQRIELKKLRLVQPTKQEKDRAWYSGKIKMLNILKVMLEESKLKGDKIQQDLQQNRVFVVHGHDREMKLDVARTLEKLGLEPIILDEKANRGRTIIEKFEDYSDVNFAVFLLSPDDMGCSTSDLPGGVKARARQNVIFEMGYFNNKLGRHHSAALCRGEGIEIPSDYEGVVYIPYDLHGGWKLKLVKELKECGYEIDMNKL